MLDASVFALSRSACVFRGALLINTNVVDVFPQTDSTAVKYLCEARMPSNRALSAFSRKQDVQLLDVC